MYGTTPSGPSKKYSQRTLLRHRCLVFDATVPVQLIRYSAKLTKTRAAVVGRCEKRNACANKF